MSQETIRPTQTLPTPDQRVGLTPEQQQTAIDLRQDVGEKAVSLERQKAQTERYETYYTNPIGDHRPTATTSVLNGVEKIVKQQKLNKAQKSAQKHFENNEGAYQEQARIEAEADGVEIKV